MTTPFVSKISHLGFAQIVKIVVKSDKFGSDIESYDGVNFFGGQPKLEV